MQNVDSLVLSICSNIKVLLGSCREIMERNDVLTQEIEKLKTQLIEKEIELNTKKEELIKIETKQMADNSHLVEETKSRIDELILMVDDCIGLIAK